MNPLDESSPVPAPASKSRGVIPFTRKLLLVVCLLTGSVFSYLIISRFVLMSVQIRGASMSPTLQDGERYILYRAPYLWRSPRQGEIVVIRDPEDHDLSIKRIVGLPNDIVQVKRDGIYVNNIKLAEPYLPSDTPTVNVPTAPVHLGEDDYYVLGDNRSRSADSRLYGPVQRKSILGVISKSG
jgi:signal peptidase I